MNFKSITFGKADAHTEGECFPELLSRGYLNISSVAEQALNSNVFLFLGHKGSGKSSLSEHLRLQCGDKLIVDQQCLKNFSFKYFDRLKDIEDKNIRYKKLWSWILCVKVFINLYQDNYAISNSKDDLDKVVEIFTQAGVFPLIDISTIVKRTLNDSIKASFKVFEYSHSVSRDNIDDVDVELLTDYMKTLIASFSEERQQIVIIDDLDDILSPNGIQFSVISALINEVKDLNSFFKKNSLPIKILILCRTDMFERLPDPNKNKIKQDASFTFSWYKEGLIESRNSDLVKLINIRTKLVYPEVNDVFQSFFPSSYQGKNIYSVLLDFTRHTPRDFIQLMNYIQKQCNDEQECVTNRDIENGIKEYSIEYFKQEISDEMAGYLQEQVISSVFSTLSSMHSREFSYKQFKDIFSYSIGSRNVEPDEVMRVLYECSAIGHKYSYDGGKTTRVTFKYRNHLSKFNPQDRIMLHKGLWKALNVNY